MLLKLLDTMFMGSSVLSKTQVLSTLSYIPQFRMHTAECRVKSRIIMDIFLRLYKVSFSDPPY